MTAQDLGSIDPVFCSIKDAAHTLGISTWSANKLVREKRIDSRYFGRRRLVFVASLREFIDGLPSEPS